QLRFKSVKLLLGRFETMPEIACTLQRLTRIDGVNQYKSELKAVLAGNQSRKSLFYSMIGDR
ncbi:MAG: hypothetical protein QME81_19135, partial [bacterium]|nr:hypothetical protein [bacterium]